MEPNSILRRCTFCKTRLNPADRTCPICGESVESGLQPSMISAALPTQLPAAPLPAAQPIEVVQWVVPDIEPVEPVEPVTRWASILASIGKLLRRHWQLVGLCVASIVMVLAGGYLIGWGMNVRSDLSVRQNAVLVQPAPTNTGSRFGIGGRVDAP